MQKATARYRCCVLVPSKDIQAVIAGITKNAVVLADGLNSSFILEGKMSEVRRKLYDFSFI